MCSWERARLYIYTVHNFKSNTNLLGIECRWNETETISSFFLSFSIYINRFLNDVGVFFPLSLSLPSLSLWGLPLSKWFIVDKIHVDGLHRSRFQNNNNFYTIRLTLFTEIGCTFLSPRSQSCQFRFFFLCSSCVAVVICLFAINCQCNCANVTVSFICSEFLIKWQISAQFDCQANLLKDDFASNNWQYQLIKWYVFIDWLVEELN